MLRFHTSLRPFLRLLLCLGFLTTLSAAPLHAQVPIPTVVLQDVPADVLIGEVFHFKLFFKADSTVTGFGPFVELAVQHQGADCTDQSGPCDGLSLVSANAVFANATVPLTACTAVAPEPLNLFCTPPPTGQCTGTSATPAPAGCYYGAPPSAFPPGFQRSVLLLPFGSFVPGQPDVEIDVAVKVHAFADVNAPLLMHARGGFRYGNNPLGTSLATAGPIVSTSVTPHVLRARKVYLGPEDETATGPNFPRQYTIEVDIADGQTLNNVEIEDCFPANLEFLSVATTSPLANPPGFNPSTNCVTVDFIGTLTGGPGGSEASATFNFFVPELDSSSQPVLGPSCSATSLDQATASGDWTPTDTRDSFVTDSVTATHTLTDKCLAIQKSVALAVDNGAPGPTPGDVVRYTLDFQLSDFRTIRNLVIDDYLSDGQTLTAPPPTLTIRDKFGGPLTGPFSGLFLSQTVVPAAPCQSADPTINPQRIRFQVSALLATLNVGQPRHLAGILTGGLAGSPAGGAATGQITFFATIDDQYLRQPGALKKPFVDKGDPLLNCTTATAQVLQNVNAPVVPATPDGTMASDSSALEFRIVIGLLDKKVYAVNGITSPLPTKVHPGDKITFRIQYPIPSSDAEQLKVVDYSPIPVLPIPSTFSLTLPCNPLIPPLNQAVSIGPFCLFATTGVSPSAADNSLTFNYGDINDTTNTPRTMDLRYTVQVSPAPFVDGLQLTNEAYETESDTFGLTFAQAAIAQITLCEPKLRVRKGVVRTNKPGALFSPSPPAPTGVTFALPGTAGPAFTGAINSSNVSSSIPDALHSDLSGVDGCDKVKYAVVIENLGCSSAFDVKVRDLVPACMSSKSNLQVRNGNGVPLAFSGSLFGTGGITLADSASAGSLAPHSATGGNNIAVITFDTQIGCNVPATGCCTNTGKLLNYAGVEGGPNHVGAGFSTPFPGASSPFSDDAKVCVQPKLTKSITGTSEPHTGTVNGVTQLAIGEIVTYKLEVVVPEGTSPGMMITDLLPSDFRWLPPCSVVKNGPITTTLNNLSLNGSLLTLNLGNVTNNANNPAPETITITCKALVRNVPANVKPSVKPNFFSVKVQGVTYTSNTVQAVIVEPAGSVTKQELPSPVPGNAVYLLGYTNTGTATAFDLTLIDNLPAGLTLSGSVSVSPASCTLTTTATQVIVKCPSVPVGGMVKVQLTVKGVSPCKPAVNTAQLTHTSLPGLKGTGNVTPGASGAPNGERIYSSSASVTTNRCPDLVLTKTHTGNFQAGQNGIYTLTVTNAGNLASVPPDTVVDTLPPGFTFVSGSGNGWTCTAIGQIVTCTRNTPIPPGGSSSFTITVKVPCAALPTENCAKVTTSLELDLSDNQACDPTTVVSPVPGCTPPPSNMTAWWPFDETAGTIAVDIAGAVHNNGTHQQGPTPTTPGKVAGALCFDGVDDRVEVPDEAEIDVDAGDFTIDAWIRTTASSGIRTIIDKRDHSPEAHGYSFFLVNGQLFLQMAVGTGSSFCSNSPADGCTNFSIGGPNVANGQWRHVAVTVDRDNPAGGLFYVDGSPVPGSFNPTIRSQSLGNGAGARIGLRALAEGGGAQFDGCLDEIEIFKRVLSPGEIKAIFAAGSAGKCKCFFCVAPPAHMVGWWPLDEGAGATSFQDLIGGNNATPFASPVGGAQAPQPVSGTVNGATHFPKFGNGLSGARVSPQGALATVGSADFTIDAWVEFQSAPANQPHYIVNKFNSVQNKGYALYVISPGIAGNERLEFKWGDGANVTTVQTISPLTPGQWHHVAVTFARNVGGNALDIRLYVDGTQQGQQTGSPPGLGSLVNFVFLEIGWQPGTLDKPITIDELEIFNVALPQSDIQSIYDAGSAGKCK